MTEEIKAVIYKKTEDSLRLFEEGKYEEIWDRFYLPDAIIFPPRSEPCGKTGFIAAWKKLKEDDGIVRLEIFDRNILILSDTAAVDTGRSRLIGKDGKVLQTASGMGLWEKKDGDWFLRYDMWN